MAIRDKWCFTNEYLEQSPSRRCNIPRDKEMNYRLQTATLIQHVGQQLVVNQLCINTAIVYMHRFYVYHSFSQFHRNKIAMAALFLASKVEEQYKKAESIVRVAHQCLYKNEPPLVKGTQEHTKLIQELMYNESILLQTLGFELAIIHPHKYIVEFSKKIPVSKDLTKISYFMATNSLRLTNMCLQYKPEVVACLCIYISSRWAGYPIPKSSQHKYWFSSIDPNMTIEELDSLADNYMKILKQCDSKLESRVMKMLSNKSPNSSLINEFNDQNIPNACHSMMKSNEEDGTKNVFDRNNNSSIDSALLDMPEERNTNDVGQSQKTLQSNGRTTSIDKIKFEKAQLIVPCAKVSGLGQSLPTITETSKNNPVEKQNVSPILEKIPLLFLKTKQNITSKTGVPLTQTLTNETNSLSTPDEEIKKIELNRVPNEKRKINNIGWDDITNDIVNIMWKNDSQNSSSVLKKNTIIAKESKSTGLIEPDPPTDKLVTELSTQSTEVIKDLLKHSTSNLSLLNKLNTEDSVTSRLENPIINGSTIPVASVSTDESTTISSTTVMNRKRNGVTCGINKNLHTQGQMECQTHKKNSVFNQQGHVVDRIGKPNETQLPTIKLVIPKTKLQTHMESSKYDSTKTSLLPPPMVEIKEPLKLKIRTNVLSQSCDGKPIVVTRKRIINDLNETTTVPEKTFKTNETERRLAKRIQLQS